MKKIFYALIAALMVCSCTKSQEDVLYRISVAPSHKSITGVSPSAGRDVLEECSQKISEFISTNSSAFNWVDTVKNSKYSSSDKSALSTYNRYLPDFKAIGTTYQAKLDACGDTKVHIDVTYEMYVVRLTGEEKELARDSFTLTLN